MYSRKFTIVADFYKQLIKVLGSWKRAYIIYPKLINFYEIASFELNQATWVLT